jgi:hypothetical protein
MIAIVAQRRDVHAQTVRSHLEGRGAAVVVLDPNELGRGAELTFSPHSAGACQWRRCDGTAVSLAEIGAAWLRPKAGPMAHAAVGEGSDRRFILREWSELFRGWLSGFGVPLINPPRAVVRASKPVQLVAAMRAGLAVPETVFTSDLEQAKALAAGPGPTLHKPMTPPPDALHPTKLLSEADLAFGPELALAPTIFQRRVPGNRELRITAVGERLFASEFRTELVDGRLDHAVPHAPHDLPRSVADALQVLLERLDLPYAAIDMRIDPDGEYHFLELNPAGQYLWIEIATGLPISAAIADLLIEKAGRA